MIEDTEKDEPANLTEPVKLAAFRKLALAPRL
jgi:hypothetical protein